MIFLNDLLAELEQEAAVTRRFLERVPFDKKDFRPHEKSEPLGRLAIHVAEIIAWWEQSLNNDELDFIDFEPKDINDTTTLLNYFDDLLAKAVIALKTAKSTELEKNWTMRHGDDILFTLKKREILRKFCMNHLIHHRAQLGIYLRLLGIPVPAVYGPSADDFNVTLIESFAKGS